MDRITHIKYGEVQRKEQLPISCSNCAGVGSSISFKNSYNYFQDVDGTVRCQNCGHNFGVFEKFQIITLLENKRDDNILP